MNIRFNGFCWLSAIQRRIQDPKQFHFSPVVFCVLKRETSSLRIGSFRKSKTSADRKLSNKNVIEENNSKPIGIYGYKHKNVWKFLSNIGVCGLLAFQRENQDLKFSLEVQRVFMGWKKKVKIFIPNRQFRETNTLLQIEKLSNNTFMEASESKAIANYG